MFLLAPFQQAHAGEADEVLLGFVFGTTFGLLFGGAMLIFYTNPESDRNIETVLITSGLIGATGGILFGTFLPDDAVEKDPIVSMISDGGDFELDLGLPTLSVAPIMTQNGYDAGVYANIIRFNF